MFGYLQSLTFVARILSLIKAKTILNLPCLSIQTVPTATSVSRPALVQPMITLRPAPTTQAAPTGSPLAFVNVGSDSVLIPGETATVVLQFNNPTRAAITYNTRVLGGVTP
jgi:hypothetical protein